MKMKMKMRRRGEEGLFVSDRTGRRTNTTHTQKKFKGWNGGGETGIKEREKEKGRRKKIANRNKKK